ncbi:TIGR03084 family metal-binding protein [Streptomyces sp. NPDC053427]|uniref:TIGR03084 family metal-binding protein n=1 Tax=Streptomyces sp. NPDC053427 TaxID=3365701 RepID=UPI0037D207C4
MSEAGAVLADLTEESEELDALVAGLPAERWATPTPAAGWTLAHQIAHLAWTDQKALLAATDPDRFLRVAVPEALAAPLTFVDEGAEAAAQAPPAELLQSWRAGREALREALTQWPAGDKLPWYGPPMSVASMASARLMETWAHGQDVADALEVTRTPTARLRHIARIGVRTRNFAYSVHHLTPPEEEFRVELRAPWGSPRSSAAESGGGRELWAYGPQDAAQRVTGDALEFCLLATQRAHRADLPSLRAEGADAERWLGIAQAFAGPPGTGRPSTAKGGAR